MVAGEPHHIIQRGNNQQDVFFVDDVRRGYLKFLREHAVLSLGVEPTFAEDFRRNTHTGPPRPAGRPPSKRRKHK